MDLNFSLQALEQQGAVLLKAIFTQEQIAPIALAAQNCFTKIDAQIAAQGILWVSQNLPSHYQFDPRSTSVGIRTLSQLNRDLELPLHLFSTSPLVQQICQQHWSGSAILCNLTHSRVRKQYALSHYHPWHVAHRWHQDGGLKVEFGAPGDSPWLDTPITPLLTAWLPLTPCGDDRPGLELVTHRLNRLLHFPSLTDSALQQLFPAEAFWKPVLEPGDLLLFLPGTLHRTNIQPDMTHDRLSLELRLFATAQIPVAMSQDDWITVWPSQ